MSKNLIFVFLLFLVTKSFSQQYTFNYKLAQNETTSAGVYTDDSILVRTLWNAIYKKAGTYSDNWDGKDDYGNLIKTKGETFKVKVMSNNVKFTWEGAHIGNTSIADTGIGKHVAYYNGIKDLCFVNNFAWFCTGYAEGRASYAKFDIKNPNKRIDFFNGFNGRQISLNEDIVCTDGKLIYYAGYDANAGKYQSSFDKGEYSSMVHAFNAKNDDEYIFTTGVPYIIAISSIKIASAISLIHERSKSHFITGLAVQKKGNYLFVARGGKNELQILDKTTGALVKSYDFNRPRSLCVDKDDNLWIVIENNICKYLIGSDGSLKNTNIKISSVLNPAAIQVNPTGDILYVADQDVSSQQLKLFNNTDGSLVRIIGKPGGYSINASVTNDKFYWTDVNGDMPVAIAFQPDGSYWITDHGNYRVQHYTSSFEFIDRIMFLGASYHTDVDPNNISRLFFHNLEFSIDYTKPLTANTGWTLVNNWGANISKSEYDKYGTIDQVTLKNGKTYGTVRNKSGKGINIFEFVNGGTARLTSSIISIQSGISRKLGHDGSIQEYTINGSIITLKRYPLEGFKNDDPEWSSKSEILATAASDTENGNAVMPPNSTTITAFDKIVWFNTSAMLKSSGQKTYMKGSHLQIMSTSPGNRVLATTEKSTHRDYSGPYPPPGWFDVGNNVRYAGGNANAVDHLIITSYHGEFWKNSQTNMYNAYWDNGLALGQFGTVRIKGTFAQYAMAGNALTPMLVRYDKNTMYLYHGDEASHSAIHRWKVSGLNTVSVQSVSLQYQNSLAKAKEQYVNLMAGLPFDNVIKDNAAGWTTGTLVNNRKASDIWNVMTSGQSYDFLNENDITVEFQSPVIRTNYLDRDLGQNLLSKQWEISGKIAFPPGNNANGKFAQQYTEILDDKGKIIANMYLDAPDKQFTALYGNGLAIRKAADNSTLQSYASVPREFSIKVNAGFVVFNYEGFPAVKAPLLDKTADWRKPTTFRIRFLRNSLLNPARFQTVSVKDLKFYK